MSAFDAALARLLASYYNSNPVSTANPGGLDADGHVDNFPAALDDLALVAQKYATDSAIIQAFGTVAVGAGAFRNLLINGGFDIWQKGTSFSSMGFNVIGADRWRASSDGGRQNAMSRQTFTLGQVDVPDNPSYFLRFAPIGAGTSISTIIETTVEGVEKLSGTTGKFSFWAKSSNNATLSVMINQQFGAGGSSAVFVSSITNSVPNLWTKYTLTLDFPSVLGKTLAAGNHLSLLFYTPVGLVDPIIDISNVQLEEGNVATPFERRPIAIELALARRYLQFRQTTGLAANLAHQMRATPTETGLGPYQYDAEI